MMKRVVLSTVCLSLLVLGSAGQVKAFGLNLGDEVTLDVDVGLKYGAAKRMDKQDDKLISNVNEDDGNRSFDRHDTFMNKVSAIADIELRYKDFGVFVRPRGFYDKAYDEKNANHSATNNNAVANGGTIDSNEFSDATKDRHRDEVEILDAYIYGSFEIGGGRYIDLRIGQQVVSWGESLYVQNSVANAMGPLDATASSAPGTELKEIFLPTEQAFLQVDIVPGLSLSGYYQWEWEKSRLNEQGSYFSDGDGLDEAGERYMTGIYDTAFEKTGYENARDDGQYGVALRYTADWLNDTEFGLYFVNYHDKYPTLTFNGGVGGAYSPTAQYLGVAPVAAGDPALGQALYPAGVGGWGNAPMPGLGGLYIPLTAYDPVTFMPIDLAAYTSGMELNWVDLSSYTVSYVEDIKMYGFSFGTELGDINFGGEVTYRDGIPIQVEADPNTNFLGFDNVLGNGFQVQLSAISITGLHDLWDQLTLKGEVGYNVVNGYGDNKLSADRDAWGGTIVAEAEYLQVFPGLDMMLSVDYGFNPHGTSSMVASFVEHADEIGLGLDFTYMIDYEIGIQYVDYRGTVNQTLADRDFIAVTAKYTF
jgi:hypothetical protein